MTCQKVRVTISLHFLHVSVTMTDNWTTGAFYMVGDFESARAKGEKILADLEKS